MSTGVIEIRSRDSFHRLMRIMIGDNDISDGDIVGFYYQYNKTKTTNVILYDSYTGKMINKDPLNIDKLKEDDMIHSISMKPFSQVLAPHNFHSSIIPAIGRLISTRISSLPDEIESSMIKKSLTYFILKSVGLSLTSTGPNTGYNIINQAIMAASGQDYSKMKNHLVYNYIDTNYLGEPSIHINQMKNNTDRTRYQKEMSIFFDIAKEMMVSNNAFETRILSMFSSKSSPLVANDEITFSVTLNTDDGETKQDSNLNLNLEQNHNLNLEQNLNHNQKAKSKTEPKISVKSRKKLWIKGDYTSEEIISTLIDQQNRLVESIQEVDIGSIDGMIHEINSFRNKSGKNMNPITSHATTNISIQSARKEVNEIQDSIKQMINVMNSGNPVVFDLNKIRNSLDDLSRSLGMDEIQYEDVGNGSYPCIITVGNQIDENVNITLKSGNSIILPSMNANVSYLDTDTLKEIISHLDSLDSIDTYSERFNALKIIVMRELAVRRKI